MMLHPVGHQSASVYWRRRLVLLAALLLVALSIFALLNSGGGDGGSTPPVASAADSRTSSPAPSTSAQTTSRAVSTSPSPPASTVAAPVNCTASQLRITAASNAKTYPVNATPLLSLIVTDVGPRPCITDLADRQIELRVFAGSARVWGSHDCEVQPGTSRVTLPVGRAIQREIQWSGLSSQPACAGVRQRVPAGTYTVYALLAGRQGTPATFVMAG